MKTLGRWQWGLLLFELSLLTLIIVVGFIFHDGERNLLRARFWANLVPLVASWAFIGFLLKIYATDTLRQFTRLWRPLLCALAALSIMLWARALWLDADTILLLFANVFGALLLGSVLVWRTLLLVGINLWEKYH